MARACVAQLAKLKANTIKGIEMKAMALALTYDTFDQPDIYIEPLHPR